MDRIVPLRACLAVQTSHLDTASDVVLHAGTIPSAEVGLAGKMSTVSGSGTVKLVQWFWCIWSPNYTEGTLCKIFSSLHHSSPCTIGLRNNAHFSPRLCGKWQRQFRDTTMNVTCFIMSFVYLPTIQNGYKISQLNREVAEDVLTGVCTFLTHMLHVTYMNGVQSHDIDRETAISNIKLMYCLETIHASELRCKWLVIWLLCNSEIKTADVERIFTVHKPTEQIYIYGRKNVQCKRCIHLFMC